jgi:hypothetical protein
MPTLRLQTMVAHEIMRLGNSARLAAAINDANARAGSSFKIDRRTLRKIRDEPGNVGLTLGMLIALHQYFKTIGQALTRLPILMTRGVVEPLCDSECMVFMLGARPRPTERRVDLIQWDALALAELVGAASRADRRQEFDIEPVLWRRQVAPSALRSEKWYSLLDKDRTSVISIGSPLAALSSEVMLARMFNVEPFQRPRFSTKFQLPFYFVWLPRVARNFQSAFGLTAEELELDFKTLAPQVREGRSAAFILKGVAYPVPAEAKSWTMYGIIAAQRRASGSVWLVVSGLAGPATLAAARLVRFLNAELPIPAKEHQDSAVLWMPIKANIKVGQPSGVESGDLREVVSCEFMGEPNYWPAPDSPTPPEDAAAVGKR